MIVSIVFLFYFLLSQGRGQQCSFQTLQSHNLIDYDTLLTDAHLIIDFEPNQNYFAKNISLECYMQTYRDKGKSCPELFHNASHKKLFLYKIHKRYLAQFRRACQKPYRACFALENYDFYDRSFFDCHEDLSDIFLYMGSQTLVKVDREHLGQYPSKPTGDAVLYKVAPEDMIAQRRFLYKVTLAPFEMISHDARVCHSVILREFPVKRIVCLY